MTTFNFANPSTAFSSVFGASSVSFTDSAVQFTLSISNGDNNNFGAIGSSSLSFTNSGDGGLATDVFALDPVGAGMTKFTGNISISVSTIRGSWSANGFALGVGNNIIASGVGGVGAITFTHGVGSQTLNIISITGTVNCFLTGTGIATPDGAVAVETLQPGMRILTADGGETTVKWLGEQPVATRFLHPAKINPICIRAGAIAPGVPSRDLFVSQDHAIAIDGLLINAGALVNGTSIYQVAKMPLDGFSYYHVETEAHELLLAEGCAAESFIDYAGRDSFINGDESDTVIAEMDLPRISAARLVPQNIKARLLDRAVLPQAA